MRFVASLVSRTLVQTVIYISGLQYLCEKGRHAVQIISSDQELQAQLRRDIHVGNILAICVFLIVVQVLANFLENDPASYCQPNILAAYCERGYRHRELWAAYLIVGKSMRLRVVSWKPAVVHVSL